MAECTSSKLVFSSLKRQEVQGYFDEGRGGYSGVSLRRLDQRIKSFARSVFVGGRVGGGSAPRAPAPMSVPVASRVCGSGRAFSKVGAAAV